MKDASTVFHWVFESIYLKHAFDGVGSLIFGFNRKKFDCDQVYCHFQSPQKFMDFIGMRENLPKAFSVIIATLVILHIATFQIMRHRLIN